MRGGPGFVGRAIFEFGVDQDFLDRHNRGLDKRNIYRPPIRLKPLPEPVELSFVGRLLTSATRLGLPAESSQRQAVFLSPACHDHAPPSDADAGLHAPFFYCFWMAFVASDDVHFIALDLAFQDERLLVIGYPLAEPHGHLVSLSD